MQSSRRNMAEANSTEPDTSPTAESSSVKSFYNFPSLGRLFEGAETKNLLEMRGRLTHTQQDLERVVRQGASVDAARAADAAKAYGIVLSLLDSLEEMRRNSKVTPR